MWLLFYTIFALPALIVVVALYDHGVKKLKGKSSRVIATTALIFLVFTPVMGNGSLIAIPVPSYLLLLALLAGDVSALMLNVESFTVFLGVSGGLSFIASVAISLYINTNNLISLTGANKTSSS